MSDASFGNVPAQPAPNNRNRNTIIVVVVVLLLLCCCCIAIVTPVAWLCGDVLTGVSTQCAPPLGP
jgi:hypothetical protein